MQINRKIAISLCFSLLVTMAFASVVSAASLNTAMTVPTVGIGPAKSLGTVQILETTYGAVTSGLQLMVTLPPNTFYVSTPLPANTAQYVYIPVNIGNEINALAAGDVVVDPNSTDTTMILNIVHVSNPGLRSCIHLLFNSPGFSQVNINGGTGEFQIHLFEATGAISSGTLGISRTASGYANVVVTSLPALTVGPLRTLGSIRIEENLPGALTCGLRSISLTLPSGVTWKGASVNALSGFVAGDITVNGIEVDEYGNSRMWLDVNHNSIHSVGGAAGRIEFVGSVDISSSAVLGDLRVSIGGVNAGLQSQVLSTARITVSTEEHDISKFTIGLDKYTLNSASYSMEVAPYIKNGRTYLPLYYAARAIGIEDNSISWDAGNQTITLHKGEKTVHLKIGSNVMLVNSSVSTLDAMPEIKNGRTCLPISAVAAAFGYTVSWDAINQTTTIQ